MSAWQKQHNADSYVDGVRATIPLIADQIDLLHRLIDATLTSVTAVLDLGCGDGALSATVLDRHAEAEATLVDFSEPMLERVRTRFEDSGRSIRIVSADLGDPGWLLSLPPDPVFDLVVSGYAIHHLPDDRKQSLFAEILSLLRPGGLFVNLEHVATDSTLARNLFDEMFIDNQFSQVRSQGESITRQEIANRYHGREGQHDNILSPVDEQCDWMRSTGFVEVDCYFKILELAVLAGRRPA